MNPAEAVALPHVLNLNSPTIIEKGTALEALTGPLTAMGHTVVPRDLESGLHIIQRVRGGYRGGADPRRDGVAIGD